jgi:integrase
MAPPLVRTATPGIYKRGSRYVVVFRDPSGRQCKRAAKTLAEARNVKASLTADVRRGEYREQSRLTFADYAAEWLDTYTGRTRRGVREQTKADYRARLEADAIPFLGRLRLAEVEPRDVKALAKRVADRGVSANTVRLALAPVRALFATAVEEGLIRSNPTVGVRIAAMVVEEADDEKVKAMTEEELRALLDELPDEWRLFFEFLAHTGLRIGEAIAIRWGDVDLGRRRFQVRRRYYRGTFAPPKSKYGRRDVPLSEEMARALWTLRATRRPGDDELLFTSEAGRMIDQSNLASRVLKPAAVRAGLGEWVLANGRRHAHSWVGFHAFRHTAATLLFRAGLNAKQVQMWLGHHSPAFTLATYVHLLPEDLVGADFLDGLTAPSAGRLGEVPGFSSLRRSTISSRATR